MKSGWEEGPQLCHPSLHLHPHLHQHLQHHHLRHSHADHLSATSATNIITVRPVADVLAFVVSTMAAIARQTKLAL